MDEKYVMACVTAQLSCTNIISIAKTTAENVRAKLIVVTVQPKEAQAENRARDMKTIQQIADENNTEVNIIYSTAPMASLVKISRKYRPIHIFTGNAGENSKFVMELAYYTNTPVSMVTGNAFITIPAPETI